MATEEQKNNIIDGMIRGRFSNLDTLTQWHRKKGTTIGGPIEIKVYLADLTTAAQGAVKAAYQYWENLSGITFKVVTDEFDADIIFNFKDFSADPNYNSNLYGASTLPPTAQDLIDDPDHQAEVSFNIQKGASRFENAQSNPRYWRVLVHEIGHALGLEHPFDNKDSDTAPEANNSLYSIMAKKHPEGIPVGTGETARLPNETPMVYDILAMQKLYGKNMSYMPGDDTYHWDTNNHYLAIWDAGGNDTIDVSNQDGEAVINLNEFDNGGGEVKITNSSGQVSLYAGIAFDTVIENATGTNQDDEIIGNTEDNVLKGEGGADNISGNGGNDTLIGGTGNDTFIIHGTDEDPEAFDTFNGGADTDTIRVNSLSLAENSIEVIDGGGGNNNIIAGTSGNNTIDLSGIAVSNINRIEGGGWRKAA